MCAPDASIGKRSRAKGGAYGMANYHLHASVVKRSAGRSATAAAAYRSATVVRDERTDETHDYTRKQGVVHSEIVLPDDAPERFRDRSTLWSEAEIAERRKDAQVAREFEGSLPRELDREDHILIAREFARGLAERGMCVDISIHDRGDGNPHFHALATTRSLDEDGFGQKNRDWNDKSLIEQERERFAEIQNRELERAGREERVDHRSYEDRGIELAPTRHEGPMVREIEEREERACEREGREYVPVTEVRRENVEIEERNSLLDRMQERLEELREQAREFAEHLRENLEAVREEERRRGVKLNPVERFQRVFGRCDELRDRADAMRDRAEGREYNESFGIRMEAREIENRVDRAVDRMADEYSRLDMDDARDVRSSMSGRTWDEDGDYVERVREVTRHDSLDMNIADARDAVAARHEEWDQDRDRWDGFENDRSDDWDDYERDYEIERW